MHACFLCHGQDAQSATKHDITHKLTCPTPQVPLTLHETITLSPANGLLVRVMRR